MTASARRLVLYVAGALLLGGLAWAGFVRTVPPDAGTRLSGARLLASIGKYDEAIATCDELLGEQPDLMDAKVFKATFLSLAERNEEAVALYDDVLVTAGGALDEPTRRDLIQDRASVLLAAGRRTEFEAARAELARDPADPRPWALLGLRAESDSDWDTATSAYRAVLERDPEDDRARKRLLYSLLQAGETALAAGRLTRAAERFDEARLLRPDYAPSHLQAADVRRRLGEDEKAVGALSAAVALDPEAVRELLADDVDAWARYHDRETLAGLCPDSRR